MSAPQFEYSFEIAARTETKKAALSTDWALQAIHPVDRASNDAARKRVSRLLIVDNHAVFREGLRLLLKEDASIDIVGEADCGHSALAMCRSTRPDIVLTDLDLPSLDGIEAVRMIRRRWPEIHILVLTGTLSESRAAEAFNAGAHGYVLKRSRLINVLNALHAVRAGLPYVDSTLNTSQINALRHDSPKDESSRLPAALTSRERQILKLIAEGSRNRDIAERLTISQKTVETHRLNMMQKLDAHNVAELVQWACRLGLTTF